MASPVSTLTPDIATLALLEWPVLFEELLAFCLTPYGMAAWEDQPFLENADAVTTHQAETDALKTILMRFNDPQLPQVELLDIRPALPRLEKGGVLSLEELKHILNVLRVGASLSGYFQKHLEKAQSEDLKKLLSQLPDSQACIALLETYLDSDGELKETASALYTELRQKFRSQKKSMQLSLQNMLNHPDNASVFQDMTVTEREGRYVLPVRIEQKSKVPGTIHGVSSSGSTVFVEPHAVSELNNGLQETLRKLEKETQRILGEVSQLLSSDVDMLRQFTKTLGQLDRRYAAAKLAVWLKANPVTVIADSQMLHLRNARHPLLVMQNKLENPVVGNDITLGNNSVRTMIITGPNTGGKTVLLKTVGLLSVMLWAGLLLPVAEASSMALFNPVLADIGDQQSITQNLSTFSAHLEKLRRFLDEKNNLSAGLILIDEIASGTDPSEGSALARAVIDTLHAKGGLTLVTTHLGELKLEAHEHVGYTNASMAFNPDTLSPTYQLIMGVPGTSNAITIAQKLGLSVSVIEKARRYLTTPERDTAALIEELEHTKRKLTEELTEAQRLREEAEIAYQEWDTQRTRLANEKRRMLQTFKAGLKSRIHELEDELKMLRKAVQHDSDITVQPSRLKAMGKSADALFDEVGSDIETLPTLAINTITVGDYLYSRQLDTTAEVVALGDQEVTLQAGLMRVTVPVSDLQKPATKPDKQKQRSFQKTRKTSAVTAAKEAAPVQRECDVRGQRVDEALTGVEKFIDDALLANVEVVAVIHGHGTGALKLAIREALKQNPAVQKFYPSELDQGGDGRTVIEL